MAKRNRPADDRGMRSGGFLRNLTSIFYAHWLYFTIGLFFLVGVGLVGILGWWFVQQQNLVAPIPPPRTPAASARIVVQPSSGVPGSLLQVSGQNWRPGDVIFISLEAPFVSTKRDFAYAGAVTDDDGKFRVSFTFPQEDRWKDAGAIKVVAWAEQSGAKAVTIFQVVSETSDATSLIDKSPAQISEPFNTTEPISEPPVQAVEAQAAVPAPGGTPTVSIPAENWYGEYFDNSSLDGPAAFFRDDPEIRFDWGNGSPDETLKADGFSIRWTRYVSFSAGVYRFFAQADDGVRLWVDDRLTIDQWHQGSSTTYVADTYLWEGPHLVRIEYYEDTEQASVRLWWQKQEVFPDWKAEYFENSRLAGQPVMVRNDPGIRFTWSDAPPALNIPINDFSVRWTRRVRFNEGKYRFYVHADSGMRVWLDSSLVMDYWQNSETGLRTADLSLGEGEYSVRVDYYNDGGQARAEFWWEALVATPTAPLSQPPAVPMAGASAEAEESAIPPVAMALPPATTESGPPLETQPPVILDVPVEVTPEPESTAPPNFTISIAGVSPNTANERALQVEPSEVTLNGEFTVRSRGWQAGEQIIISLVKPGENLDQAPPFATVLADNQGTVSAKLTMPSDPTWLDYDELIVLAHNIDWTTRLVSPLYVIAPSPPDDLQPLSNP